MRVIGDISTIKTGVDVKEKVTWDLALNRSSAACITAAARQCISFAYTYILLLRSKGIILSCIHLFLVVFSLQNVLVSLPWQVKPCFIVHLSLLSFLTFVCCTIGRDLCICVTCAGGQNHPPFFIVLSWYSLP